jgi:hypothetical protein
MAQSGSIEFNLNADETFEALCAAVLAEGHHLGYPDFSNLMVPFVTKLVMGLGSGEEIHLAVSPKAGDTCIVHYTGVNVVGKSWAKRTVGKIVARISNAASRQIVIQQQANAIAHLKANYQSAAAIPKAEPQKAAPEKPGLQDKAAQPADNHFQEEFSQKDQNNKDQALGCAIVGWGAAGLVMLFFVVSSFSWTPERHVSRLCANAASQVIANARALPNTSYRWGPVLGSSTNFRTTLTVDTLRPAQRALGSDQTNRRSYTCRVQFEREPNLFSAGEFSISFF